ncbi:MAG: glycosyltransferase [Candidatus Omnitrophica bacterium]|nr:glycosyltransferase [Candidatus Omnitrophota bacterium]
MKILVIHNHYLEKGGEDEVFNAEVKLLEEHGHKVILYEKTNEYIKSLPFLKKFIFAFTEPSFSKTVYEEIKEIVKKEKPDIAHVHNIFICITTSVYAALKEEGIPIVQTLHNYRFFCSKGTFFNNGVICERCKNRNFFNGVVRKCWRNSFFLSFFSARLLDKWGSFFKNIDSYIVLSKFSRDKFVELGLDGQRMYLKTNFLTTEPTGIKQDRNYAVFIGRIVDYKGIGTLMKAFKINPTFNLKIIGDGPLNNEVRDCAATYDNVECLGQLNRDSVFKVINNSSFIIFPSECYENMPMVILESFASSKPVLASKLGSIKEFVIDGVNGVLFEPGNAEDLAAKISYLFSHNEERIQMGENANLIYREKFNKENNYRDLEVIYRRTIEINKNKLNSLTLTYSLADQNFRQAKSLGVFNVSRQLLENLALRSCFTRLDVLTNSTLDDTLQLSGQASAQHYNKAIGNKIGRIIWDQWGAYGAVRNNGSQWLFLPKGFSSLLKPRGFKLAVYIHDAMHDFYRNNYPGAMSWFEIIYFIKCIKATLKNSDLIFTNSDFSKGELKRLAYDFRLELPPVIVAGIGFTRSKDAFSTERNSLLLLTSAWPHKLTKQAVGFIERWQKESGFSGNIELVGSIPAGLHLPHFESWRHHQRLSESAYRHFLAKAKILLFFSKYEGFGMPPVEAMIAGACPVFSDLPATREIMSGGGFSFSNDSYESFAQAMDDALNASTTQIQLWAEQLLERHNWNKVVEKIINGFTQFKK